MSKVNSLLGFVYKAGVKADILHSIDPPDTVYQDLFNRILELPQKLNYALGWVIQSSKIKWQKDTL